jgi:hypothetical protein
MLRKNGSLVGAVNFDDDGDGVIMMVVLLLLLLLLLLLDRLGRCFDMVKVPVDGSMLCLLSMPCRYTVDEVHCS